MQTGNARIIDLTPENISEYGVCGYKDVDKHVELKKKIEWFKDYYPKGLRIKALIIKDGGYQGMLEYIPGKYAHRPVDAEGYMFIHCIFTGFKKEFKRKGYGTALIEECMKDAREQKLSGVAVVTRKGSFMAQKDIFLKNGFRIVDHAKPDFDLLAFKFDESTSDPRFKPGMADALKKFDKGLTILRSPQCPYTEKNVKAIIGNARNKFNLAVNLIELIDSESAQATPCAFGTFCIIHDGEIISNHPISNTRFENIIKTRHASESK